MKGRELYYVLAACLILSVISGFWFALQGDIFSLAMVFLFSFVVIFVNVSAKKIFAGWLDLGVEHEIWQIYQYGLKSHQHFRKEIPAGLILPLFFSLMSLGFFQFSAILSYEAKALRSRVSKRFGHYSFASLTDSHNSMIGAAGIVAMLFLSVLSYVIGFELLVKISSFYAFWNMVPLYKLDGAQIFFGNRILYYVLACFVVLFSAFALIL